MEQQKKEKKRERKRGREKKDGCCRPMAANVAVFADGGTAAIAINTSDLQPNYSFLLERERQPVYCSSLPDDNGEAGGSLSWRKETAIYSGFDKAFCSKRPHQVRRVP